MEGRAIRVYVTDDEHRAIAKDAKARGVSMSDLVRHKAGMPVRWGVMLSAKGVMRHIRRQFDDDVAMCGGRVTVADVTLDAFARLAERVRAARRAGQTPATTWNICIPCRKLAYLAMGMNRFPGARELRERVQREVQV